MTPRYVSFVVRVLIADDGKLTSGRIFRVPDQESKYFRTWDELVILLQILLSDGGDSTAQTAQDENA